MSELLLGLIDQTVEQAIEEDVSLSDLSMAMRDRFILTDVRESGEEGGND